MRTSFPESEPERAAVAHAGGHVVASPKRCPVCGEPMSGRKTSACSDKCRAAKSRRRRVSLPVEEARAMKASVTTILETVWEIQATLERYTQ